MRFRLGPGLQLGAGLGIGSGLEVGWGLGRGLGEVVTCTNMLLSPGKCRAAHCGKSEHLSAARLYTGSASAPAAPVGSRPLILFLPTASRPPKTSSLPHA